MPSEQKEGDVTNGTKQGPPADTWSLASLASTVSSKVQLRRTVSLLGASSMVIGTIIGSGIFISPKGVTSGSGSVGLSLISWTLCGIISMFGALCYTELGTMLPKSGGEFVYINEVFGPIPAYVAAWTVIFVLKPSGAAIIALTCGEYVMTPFFDDDCGPAPELHIKIIAVIVVLLLCGVNCYNTKLASRVQIVFTVAKLGALLIIIVGGIVRLIQGYTDTLETGFEGTETSVGVIAIGLYNGMWAYGGWYNLNYISEEVVNPNRNLPLAIIIGLPLVTVLYLLTNISYFTVMSIEELLESPAVAITWAEEVLQEARHIIPVAVALSTFGAVNGTLFAGSRMIFAAAREKQMVRSLSMMHVENYTPTPAIVLITIISLCYIFPSDIGTLIDFFNFAQWLMVFAVALGLLIMRRTRRDTPRPFKVPIWIPVLVVLASAYLVIAPIQDDPQIQFLFAFLFMVGGLVFYYPFVHRKMVLPGTDTFELYTQLFLQVVPPAAFSDTEPEKTDSHEKDT